MQLGLFLPTVSPIANPEWLLSIAGEVEDRGVTTVWIPEHVVQFDEYESRYPYSPDGEIPVPSTSGMLEPTTTLGSGGCNQDGTSRNCHLPARTAQSRLCRQGALHAGLAVVGKIGPRGRGRMAA